MKIEKIRLNSFKNLISPNNGFAMCHVLVDLHC